MQYLKKNRLSARAYVEGVLQRDKSVLSKAITLVESDLGSDQELALQVLEGILPHTGTSQRIGITGVPGVGKSTFIEALGAHLIDSGNSIAVLAVDPSSQKTKGSILGDKTRMPWLSKQSQVFIRPSPAGKSLGGVAQNTRETMLLCEAAGFDTVLVETVGVGQSETVVRNMVDFFMLLMLAGAGDELQGIKKGIMEMADAVVITKADGDNLKAANQAQSVYQNALHLLSTSQTDWSPPVLTCSALQKQGIKEVWETVQNHHLWMVKHQRLDPLRARQRLSWLQDCLYREMERAMAQDENLRLKMRSMEEKVQQGSLLPGRAAAEIRQQLFKN